MIKTLIFATTIVMLLSAAIVVAQSAGPPASKTQAHTPTASDGEILTGRAPAQFDERYPRYRLRANDVMEITFEFTPEFNQTVTVQPDGYIALRGAGDLHVSEETIPEVTESIRTAYSKILYSPSIAIVLKDFDKPYFTAGGAVGRPGKYDLRGDTTVAEAIIIAGGFSDSAKHSQVLLFRRVSRDWMEGRIVDVKKMLNQKNLSEDLHLQPGDMIFVPQSQVSKIRRYIPVPGLGIGMNPIP
jgi:polysaccharide export outer membrane protein